MSRDLPTVGLDELVELRPEKVAGNKDPNLRYIGLEHIAQGRPCLLGSLPSSASVSINCRFAKDDILFGKLRPNLRKSLKAPFAGYCSTDILVLRARESVLPSYAAHVLQWERVFAAASVTAVGTKMPRTSWSELRRYRVFRPASETEQSRIAAVLDTVDEAIAKTERVIAKLRQVRAGLLHDLLTRGLDPHGQLRDPVADREQFKESFLGRIPREWDERTIDQVGGVTKLAGFEFTNFIRYSASGEVIALRALNIKNEDLDLSDIQRISKAVSESLPRSKVCSGDILITYIGAYIGDVLLVKQSNRFHLAPNIAKITTRKGTLPDFLQWQLRSPITRKQMAQLITTTATPSLTMTQIRELKVAIPRNQEEQVRIVELVSSLNSALHAEILTYDKMTKLRLGLMTDLLAGHVPVPETICKTS